MIPAPKLKEMKEYECMDLSSKTLLRCPEHAIKETRVLCKILVTDSHRKRLLGDIGNSMNGLVNVSLEPKTGTVTAFIEQNGKPPSSTIKSKEQTVLHEKYS
jgi:hypothetical protein